MRYNTLNDAVYAITKRAKELGDLKMDALRSSSGYGINTPAEAIRTRFQEGLTRGDLIELILTEEFIEEDHLNPTIQND